MLRPTAGGLVVAGQDPLTLLRALAKERGVSVSMTALVLTVSRLRWFRSRFVDY